MNITYSDDARQRIDQLRTEGHPWKFVTEKIKKEFGIESTPEQMSKTIWKYKNDMKKRNDVNRQEISYANKESEIFKLRRMLSNREYVVDRILETIKSAMPALPPVKLCEQSKTKYADKYHKHKPEEPCLVFTDPHIGKKVMLEHVAGLGEYNMQIFEDRLKNKLEDGVMRVYNIHSKVRPIMKLNIFNLGDMVENEANIFPGQSLLIDQPLMNQIMTGALKVSEFLARLSRYFPEIECFCVIGNHGRPGLKGENYYLTNWDYIFYHMLSLLLQDNKRIKFYISRSTAMGIRILNSDVFLMHGGEVKGVLGFPYYGIDRAIKNYQSATGKLWDITCMGHFHHKVAGDIATREFIASGSFCGGDLHSFRDLKTISSPKQVMFGVHPVYGKTWEYSLKLEEPKELILSQDGVYTPYEQGLGAQNKNRGKK